LFLLQDEGSPEEHNTSPKSMPRPGKNQGSQPKGGGHSLGNSWGPSLKEELADNTVRMDDFIERLKGLSKGKIQ
jgi:hypothetical protein